MRARENPPKRKHCVTDAADSTDQRNDVGTVCASPQCELNGTPASADDLRALALLNYGHFTSMQVSDGRVRGLDLHLARLDAGTRELFGRPLAADRIRGYMRSALDGRAGDASMRVTVFSRDFDRDRPARPSQVDVLTTVGAARQVSTTPLRLKSFRHERVLPRDQARRHVPAVPLSAARAARRFRRRAIRRVTTMRYRKRRCGTSASSTAARSSGRMRRRFPESRCSCCRPDLREHGVATISRRVAHG